MSDLFEVFIAAEPDRRISEEELYLTDKSRTHRWRLAKAGRYPPKGEYGPLLSEVCAWVINPETYVYKGDSVVTRRGAEMQTKIRKVRRRGVRRIPRPIDEVSVNGLGFTPQ